MMKHIVKIKQIIAIITILTCFLIINYCSEEVDFLTAGKMAVSVSSPNGGEVFSVGNSCEITWESSNGKTIDIELYNSGVYISTIVDGISDSGSYSWVIPDDTNIVSENLVLKVVLQDADNNTLADTSDDTFSISDIEVLTPNGSEQFVPGSTKEITWDLTLGSEVKIELYKGENLFTIIETNTPNDHSYDWTIPNNITKADDYKIRITSSLSSKIYDDSDNNFTICDMVVNSPNGSEFYAPSETCEIVWETNSNENVNINLYEGGTFHSAIASDISNTGNYDWNIASPVSNDYTIRVEIVSDTTVYDESDTTFSIGEIELLTPNNPVLITSGDSYNITWQANISGNAKIDLLKGGVVDGSFTPVIITNPGTIPWNGVYTLDTTGIAQANNYQIRISSEEEPNFYDVSDNYFGIGEMLLTYPNGSETFSSDDDINIAWTSGYGNKVKIELYQSGAYQKTISANTGNDGSYTWYNPSLVGADYSIKITSLSMPSIEDDSDNPFVFIEPHEITAPNGGGVLVLGGTTDIEWSPTSVYNVDIELYENGTPVYTIAAGETNDGSYTFSPIPSLTASDKYKVKVSLSGTSPKISDFSDANLTILNNFSITSPTSATTEYAGSTLNITWNNAYSWANSDGNEVKIELYKGGAYLQTITSATEHDGFFSWSIPCGLTEDTDYQIKITTTTGSGTEISDLSDNFEIIWNIIKIVASDGEDDYWFGHTVAVSGDGSRIVVGAPDDYSVFDDLGQAYIFNNGIETHKFSGSDSVPEHQFGNSVAISEDGSIVVVGASSWDEPTANNRGAVYVFDGNTAIQLTQILANDRQDFDNFGWDVAISSDGTTIVVGSPWDDDTGSVYVYRDTDGWGTGVAPVQTKILATDGAAGDRFGHGVAISEDGSTIAVGSHLDDGATGAVYVYTGAGWTVQTKIPGPFPSVSFGHHVALSGDGSTIVASSHGEPYGCVYVYNQSGTKLARLIASDSDIFADDQMGLSLAISKDGSTIVAGTDWHNSDVVGGGSVEVGEAYVFYKPVGGWVNANQDVILRAFDRAPEQHFAEDIAVSSDGSTIVVGAEDEDSSTIDSIDNSAVYIFKF